MRLQLFLFAVSSLKTVPILCRVIPVRDAVHTFEILTGQTVHRGNKTWFRYVEKVTAMTLIQFQHINSSVTLFVEQQSTSTSQIVFFFERLKIPDKFSLNETIPIFEMVPSAPYQLVRENRRRDLCHKMKQTIFCFFIFEFYLSAKLRLNLTFLEIQMLSPRCVLNSIRVTQAFFHDLSENFCGTYTPFTIYSNASHVSMTYKYDVAGYYQSLFVYSVIDPEVALSFPGVYWLDKVGNLKVSRQLSLFFLVKSSAKGIKVIHTYRVEGIKFGYLVIDMVECQKDKCWYTVTPFPQLMSPAPQSGTKLCVRGFQLLLLFLHNSSNWHVNVDEMRLKYSSIRNTDTKPVSLDKRATKTCDFEENNPDQRVYIWNITFQGNNAEVLETLIVNMSYKETLFSSPPECYHGGLSFFQLENGKFLEAFTICSDFKMFVGNRRYFVAKSPLLLIFYQYYNFEPPNSLLTAKIQLTSQSCQPVFLTTCFYFTSWEGDFYVRDKNNQYLLDLAIRLSNINNLEATLSLEEKELVLSIPQSECVIIEFLNTFQWSGISRCYLKLRLKDVLESVGAGVHLKIEGTLLSKPSELKFHHNRNVHWNQSSTFVPLSDTDQLAIRPKCTLKKGEIWSESECGSGDSFEKITGYGFIDTPFHSDDFAIEMVFHPLFPSWFSTKLYWAPHNRCNEFTEAPIMCTSDLRQPIKDLKLPFPAIARVWNPSKVMGKNSLARYFSLVLTANNNIAVNFSLSFGLNIQQETHLRQESPTTIIWWNKTSSTGSENTTSNHKKLLLMQQGGVPQFLSVEPRNAPVFLYLIYDVYYNISHSALTSRWRGRIHHAFSQIQLNSTEHVVLAKDFFSFEKSFQNLCNITTISWVIAEKNCRKIGATFPILRSRAQQDELMCFVKISKDLIFVHGIYIGIQMDSKTEVCQA